IDNRHSLITESRIAAGVGRAPSARHAEELRTAQAGHVNYRAHHFNQDIIQIALIRSRRNVEGPIRAALHFFVWPTDKVEQFGIDNRHGLITEGKVPTAIARLPGARHAEESRTTWAGHVGYGADQLDQDVAGITDVHRGRHIKGPVGPTLYLLVWP